LSIAKDINEASRLINSTFYWSLNSIATGRVRLKATISEVVKAGYNSVPIIAVISFFIGVILAFQAAYQLKRVGAMIYVADLVGVSITRELGPIITAIIIAGRSGSAYAAEIGSMKAAEEIDALISMGINPVRFLVVPKMFALILMAPALTILADAIGIIGGFVISTTALEIHPQIYYTQTVNAIYMADIVTGLIKALSFGIVITLVGAYEGFQVERGAEEVGRRTTASVVVSIFMVIFFDLFFTMLFYYFT
jgi:phospholipid/cholesterol/gamma-HCH transport system permease protein